jgi:hypothetical protein
VTTRDLAVLARIGTEIVPTLANVPHSELASPTSIGATTVEALSIHTECWRVFSSSTSRRNIVNSWLSFQALFNVSPIMAKGIGPNKIAARL